MIIVKYDDLLLLKEEC